MPDFTIPTKPWIALLLGALNTGLAFIVGAKTTDSGLSPVAVFYLACALAVMGWVLLHIVPSKPVPVSPPDAPAPAAPAAPVAPAAPPAAPAAPQA